MEEARDIFKLPRIASADKRVSVGIGTYGGTPTFLLWNEKESIRIGKFCSIAKDVVIFGGGEHRTDWVTTYPFRIALEDELAGKDGHPASKGPTIIGNDVWIGFGARILSGVTIGNGAVIGASSLVTKDVPAYSIVGGVPARVIKKRFTDAQIDALLDIAWWNWSILKIKESVQLLCSPEIDVFIKTFTKKL